MRFLELVLKAYGPFTDRVIQVADGHEGLHVIHGPNEAGKSSALRAIHAFLFGIPAQTADNFQHDYRDLRIGARLRDDEGQEHVLWRKKGNKDTLLDESEDPIEERVLASMLGGIDAPLFERGFGIDHQRLVEGGQTLLAGGGDVGESLFAAGLGGPGLRDLLKALDDECEALFKSGRATNPTINSLMGAYRKHVALVKELSLSPPEWTRHREALEEAEKRLKALDEAWEAGQAKQGRLERLERALPKLAERAERARELRSLEEAGPLPALREDFGKERQEAETARDESHRNVERFQRDIETLGEALKGIEVPEALLERRDDIDELYQEIAGHRRSAEHRVKLGSKCQHHEAAARRHLISLYPDWDPVDGEDLKLSVTERRGIDQLADDHLGLLPRLDTARRSLAKSEQALSRLAAEAEADVPQPDTEPMRKLVEQIRKGGDLEARRVTLLAEKDDAQREAEAASRRLGLWTGPLTSADTLPIPDTTTVDRFEKLWEGIQSERQDIARQQAETRKRLNEIAMTLERGGKVPTEADLGEARTHREQGWQLVRRAWLDDKPVDAKAYDDARPLDEAYEHAVRRADDVGDGLRADAQQVAEKAQLLARKREDEARLLKLEDALSASTAKKTEAQGAWREIWTEAGITPLPPREMRAWIEKHGRLRERLASVRKIEADADEVGRRIDLDTKALRDALRALLRTEPSPDLDGVAQLLDRADQETARIRRAVDVHQRHESRLEELREMREETSRELAATETDLEAWQRDWEVALSPLGLEANTTPEQARAFLTTLRLREEDLEKASGYAARVRGIDSDLGDFAEKVGRLVDDLAPALAGRTAAEMIHSLQTQVGAAARMQADQARLQLVLAEKEEEASQEQQKLGKALDKLRRLCDEAGVASPTDLADVEKRVREAERRRARILDIESELLREGRGMSLEKLEAQAAGVDGDTLAPRIQTLKNELGTTDAERQTARIALGETKKTLADLKPTADAAHEAEEAESVASAIRGHAARYVRLRLARAILQQEMERYRAANQAPLLARATDLFARITCGAFQALEADYDDSDTPVLLGRRRNGQRISLEAMSDGTREQLYLALRLASLEEHLGKGNAIPLIVDDVLLRSDDERSRAILEALADVSAKTQVLFFTHQSRYVDLARGLGRDDVFVVPALQGSA